MRFLIFAAGEFEDSLELSGSEDIPFCDFLRNTFSLDDDAATAIAFALAHCTSISGVYLIPVLYIYSHSVHTN